MKYIKRPVMVEAVRFSHIGTGNLAISGVTVNEPFFDEKPEWLVRALWSGTISIRENGDLAIRTLEGIMMVKPGDFIIRGVEGEIYACAPSIFEKTYEEAEIR